MEPILLSEEELENLLENQGEYGFSCTADRRVWSGQRVWPGDSAGLGGGSNIAGQFPALDLIVEQMLKARPEGGRFYIGDGGVYMAHNREEIVEIVITPANTELG